MVLVAADICEEGMALFEIGKDRINPLTPTAFAAAGLRERSDLQRLLRAQIGVIDKDVLVIAEEFGDWEDSRRRIDLLGVDKGGGLVVIELKRTEDGGHMELQAVRYAAMVSDDPRQSCRRLRSIPPLTRRQR